MPGRQGVAGVAVIGLVFAVLALPSGAQAPGVEAPPSIESATGSSEAALAARSDASVEAADERCDFLDVGPATGCIAIGTWASPAGGSYDYSGDLGDFTNIGTDPIGVLPVDPTSLTKFIGLAAGTYTITQVSNADTFPHGPLACDGRFDQGSLTFGTDSITIDLDGDEFVTCDFLNEAQFVEITKTDLSGVVDAEFAFTGSFGDFSLTDGGSTRFKVPNDTTYTVTEAVDESTPGLADGYRWELANLDCALEPARPDASSDASTVSEDPAATSATITFSDYESRTVTCAFSNELCADHPFSDVPLWVDPAVDWAYCGVFMGGYPDNTFRPDIGISRAQVARLVYRVNGSPDVSGLPPAPWSDIPAWIDDAARWIADNNYMTGYPGGTFRPDADINRGQVTRLTYRLAGEPGGAPDHPYSDVRAWLTEAVNWAAWDQDGAGPNPPLMTGYPGGTFREEFAITRGQTTRLTCRTNTPPGTC